MSLTGGKRKINKSLKAWVTFVKKVQKEENLTYKEAIHRAKQRKEKGEKWMIGGQSKDTEIISNVSERLDENIDTTSHDIMDGELTNPDTIEEETMEEFVEQTPSPTTTTENSIMGGKRSRRTIRKSQGRGRGRRGGRTARIAKRRASRRH